jgi:hypothetical protein
MTSLHNEQQETTMRFMVIVKATPESESGVIPTEEELNEMGRFNEELVKAGVMLDCDGLQASSKGARIAFAGGKPTVTDGPFTETKELVAGYWIIQVKSKDEAIEWMKRAPFQDANIEIRQVYEIEDFVKAGVPADNEALRNEPGLREQARKRKDS